MASGSSMRGSFGPAEILRLVSDLRSAKSDTRHVEVKAASWELPKTSYQTVSAFANTAGGLLVLGISEADGFSVDGVQNPGKIAKDLAGIIQELEPVPLVEIEVVTMDEGQAVVVADVEPIARTDRPCYRKSEGRDKGTYLRKFDGDMRATPYEVELMIAGRQPPRQDVRPVSTATRDDLRPDLVAAFVKQLRESGNRAFESIDEDEALRRMRVLVQDDDGRYVPSLGGLLALGKYPQGFDDTEALRIEFVRYPTDTIGELDDLGNRTLANVPAEGPIPDILATVLDVLRRNMDARDRIIDAKKSRIWDYPLDALREALVNAMGHRDLGPGGAAGAVQVQMFPSRLVIANPGGLHGQVSEATLGEDGKSASRNPALMKILENVPAPDGLDVVAENRGTGIATMLAALRKGGMAPPKFEDSVAEFRVTFPKHTLLGGEVLAWLARIGGDRCNAAQQMALAAMYSGDEMTNELYRAVSGVSDSRVVTQQLGQLVNEGIIDKKSYGRWATYELSERAASAARHDSASQISLDLTLDDSAPSSPGRARRDRTGEIHKLLEAAAPKPLSTQEVAAAVGLKSSSVIGYFNAMENAGLLEIVDRGTKPLRARLAGGNTG